MAGYNNSAAYDLSLFEPQIIEKPKTKIIQCLLPILKGKL